MIFRRIALLFASCSVAVALHAQALPSATVDGGISYQVGLGASIGSPDYGDSTIKGITVFANADLHMGLGLDVEYHDLNIITPLDVGESSIMAGVRYGKDERHFYPYLKALAGVGTLSFQQGYYATNSSSSYGAYAFGGGLEYHPRGRWMVKIVDLEYQEWHSFPPNGLTPYVFTFGAGYRFH
jgi:hypothetical protein